MKMNVEQIAEEWIEYQGKLEENNELAEARIKEIKEKQKNQNEQLTRKFDMSHDESSLEEEVRKYLQNDRFRKLTPEDISWTRDVFGTIRKHAGKREIYIKEKGSKTYVFDMDGSFSYFKNLGRKKLDKIINRGYTDCSISMLKEYAGLSATLGLIAGGILGYTDMLTTFKNPNAAVYTPFMGILMGCAGTLFGMVYEGIKTTLTKCTNLGRDEYESIDKLTKFVKKKRK